ncbi:MAG: ribosome silencing factor [Alphaproteobacteria bacterium]|nr:ribosome silencing factor [Alphaproteobacteria bacterium]
MAKKAKTKAKAKKAVKPAKKAAAKPAKKKAPAKPVKKAAKPAKKKVAKPAKKAPAKKAVAKKPVAKKVVAKKTAAKKVAKKISLPAPQKPAAEQTFEEKLLAATLKVLDERQADEVVTVDLHGKSVVADYVIIATSKSSRQSSAIADYLRQAFEQLGVKHIHVEGLPQGDWVLVDAGDVIVHLFRPEVRKYYAIDDLWSNNRGNSRRK